MNLARNLYLFDFVHLEADCEVQPIVVMPQLPKILKTALPTPAAYPPMTANVLQLPNLLNAKSNTFKTRPLNQNHQQSTLDEITNQVYSELLQEKVESHYNQRTSDTGSMRSGDWGSTKSSSGIFGRLKRPDVAVRNKAREPTEKTSTTASDDEATAASLAADQMKKPLIAKWKTGVKLQVTTKSENHGKTN